jgi:hypothetical protein
MERHFRYDILQDIREFVEFFRSLWGLLAGGSVFFPFINAVVGALPYPDPSVRKACGAFAMLVSAFVFLMVYMSRSEVSTLDHVDLTPRAWRRHRRLRLTGCWSSLLAVICFLAFGMLFLLYLRGVVTDEYRLGYRALDHGVLMYGMIFGFATLSFTLPATAEFMKRTDERKRALQEPPPRPYQARQAIWDRLPDSERPRYQNGLKVVQEQVFEQGGKLMLAMTVESRAATRYRVTVDGEGTAYQFEKLDS